MQTGDELQVLNAATGVTILLAVGLPAGTDVLGLALKLPSAAKLARPASKQLSPDYGPLKGEDRVTVLAGPVLAPVWTRDVPETQQN